jgi:hypothetical protein
MSKQFNAKRIGLSAAVLVLIPVIFLAYVNTTQTATNQPTTTGAIGVSPVYVWDIGNPTTLQEAANSANYSLVMPLYLPTGSSLTQVRYSEDSNFVLLAYDVIGVSAVGGSPNPGGWGLLITEQVSHSNPLPAQMTVEQPVIEKTTYPNGTVITSTIAQSSTVTSDWQSTTVSGQSILIQSDTSGQVESEIQWWSQGIWYHAFANTPMSQLEQVASSMISPSVSPSS